MNPRHTSTPRADRGAWVARAAVVVGLAASIGLLLANAGEGLDVPAVAGVQPAPGDLCVGLVSAAVSGAIGAL